MSGLRSEFKILGRDQKCKGPELAQPQAQGQTPAGLAFQGARIERRVGRQGIQMLPTVEAAAASIRYRCIFGGGGSGSSKCGGVAPENHGTGSADLPTRFVAEGCRGNELRRATIYSPICAGVPFRSEIRNHDVGRGGGVTAAPAHGRNGSAGRVR